jgi:hypothetical protein
MRDDKNNRLVVAISTTTDAMVEELSLNEAMGPSDIIMAYGAVSADGRGIYVPGNGTVCIVDTTTAAPRPNVSVLGQPISPDDLVAYLSRRVTDF